jgi:hypothetical protein
VTVNANKNELFERYMSFLDTEEELNPVLCGYFSKVFTVLVGSKTKHVFSYIYSNPKYLDLLVRHSYQKSIAEVLIRLLNTQENLFFEDCGVGYAEVNSIRQSYVYKIIQKLSPAAPGGIEDHMNACSVLSDIADYKILYMEMLSSRAFEMYKEFLSSESDSTK